MQGASARAGNSNQIGGAELERKKEIPALLSKLDYTIDEVSMAVGELVDRLGPLRIDAAPVQDGVKSALSEVPNSHIGVDLGEKIDRLQALARSVRAVTNELAI